MQQIKLFVYQNAQNCTNYSSVRWSLLIEHCRIIRAMSEQVKQIFKNQNMISFNSTLIRLFILTNFIPNFQLIQLQISSRQNQTIISYKIQKLQNMSSLKLELVHAFGSTCSNRYQNCIAICDQDRNQPKVAFPIGKVLAKKLIDRPEMDFVPFSDDTDHVENIYVLPTRVHVAVAYRPYGSQLQTIKIYSFNKEEQPISIKIFHEHQKSGHIKLLAFSPSEPKFMCTLLGQPHNKLLFVDTFKNKALAESSLALKDVDKLTICPTNSHLICVSGGSSLRMFKVQEYTFKPLEEIKKLPKGRRITTHAWYKKKMLIAATDKCELLVLQQARPNLFEIKQEYTNVFNELKPEKTLVTAICTFSKGFILGSSNGKFALWTRKEDNNLQSQQELELSRKWATSEERASEVTNINISLKQDIIVISLANNDVATLSINELIPQVSDLLNSMTDKQIVFEYVYKGFHNCSITGMDICEQRPLIATCSQQDSTIRIWNYKNYGCKLLRMFYFKLKEEFDTDKPLITLAFHPTGYYLAVACVDKLRLFHVLNNQLRPYRELGVRGAHLVKFSRGGHLLATCYPLREQTNINHIKIFNALTLQQIIQLKDHTSMVRSLEFKKYDESLLSVSQEGTIIEWKLQDWSKTKNLVKKDMKYRCGVYWHSRNSIVAFGVHKNKKYIEEFSCEGNSTSQFEFDEQVVAMAEARVGKEKALILSLQTGRLLVFGGLQRPIFMDNKDYHNRKANQIILCPTGKNLITAGEDCVVMLWKIYHQIEGVVQEQQQTNMIVDDFLADVVLINKKEIQKVSDKEKEYSKVIGNLSKKLKVLVEEGLKKHNNKMLELQLQKNRVVDDVNYRIERIKNQVDQLKGKTKTALDTLDKGHLKKAEDFQKSFQEKINFEIEKYFQLQQQLIQIRMIHKRELNEIKKMQEEEIAKIKGEFQSKFKQSEKVYSQSKKETEKAMNIFQQRLKQIEDEQEDEIKEIQSKKHKFKLETAATIEDLFNKQAKLKKEHLKLTQQRNQEKKKNQERSFSKRKIQKQVEEARQKLKEITAQYNEKIDVLRIKEKRIQQFENKITDLQKKKHILSYKGAQMKKAIEPKQMQIEKLKLDLIKLKKQFEASLERKEKSILAMQKNQKQRLNLERILNQEKSVTSKEIQTFDSILTDIYHCLDTYKKNEDVKIFYKQFIKLYHKYINKNEKIQPFSQSKGIDDLTKQVLHLQKSLFQTSKGNEKNVTRKNDQIYKRIKENTELVTNLNQIKKENKEIILQIKAKKDQIQKLRTVKNNLLAECKNLDSTTYKMFLQDDFGDYKNAEKSRASLVGNSMSSKLNILPISHKEQLNQAKKGFQRIECELISQIQFVNQKVQKMQFYLKDVKEKIKKHMIEFKCSPASLLMEQEPSIIASNNF